MKSIFTAEGHEELIRRIEKLSAHTPAEWGKMNAAQMLAHMQVGMNIAFGNSKRIIHWIGVIFGAIGKYRLLKNGNFDKHMPTFKQAAITEPRNFEEEKANLLALLDYAIKNGSSILVKYPHPYFGRLKADEWAQLNWKHFDHHLRQFGV